MLQVGLYGQPEITLEDLLREADMLAIPEPYRSQLLARGVSQLRGNWSQRIYDPNADGAKDYPVARYTEDPAESVAIRKDQVERRKERARRLKDATATQLLRIGEQNLEGYDPVNRGYHNELPLVVALGCILWRLLNETDPQMKVTPRLVVTQANEALADFAAGEATEERVCYHCDGSKALALPAWYDPDVDDLDEI